MTMKKVRRPFQTRTIMKEEQESVKIIIINEPLIRIMQSNS